MKAELQEWVIDARTRTFDLVRDLSDTQFKAPLLKIVNPFLWEIGHVAYFQEYWVLRNGGATPSMAPNADTLYDSAKVAHDTRWDLLLPTRASTLDYLEKVRDRVVDKIASSRFNERDEYFVLLSVFHEDMHDEAFAITRQTLGYPAPVFSTTDKRNEVYDGADPSVPGDVEVRAGTYRIGSSPEEGFIFDNEKWAHDVELPAFRIATGPVSQSEFAEFVEDRGYLRRDFWSANGWEWREAARAEHPVYWRSDPETRWKRRHFDQWIPLEADRPVSNICWFEAEAYCRWAERRLPTEFEWEAAVRSRAVSPSHQVWEWTASDFLPYPGFSEDAYKEYSSPWFGTHKTLRGAGWATRSRLIRPTYRNFYTPDRRDIWAGFRTCALES